MTVAVLTYWTKIERFYITAINLSCRGSITVHAVHLYKKSCNYYTGKRSLVILFLHNYIVLASLNTLCSEDVESHPGPIFFIKKYLVHFIKAIQGLGIRQEYHMPVIHFMSYFGHG